MQSSIAALERNYQRDIADQESVTVQLDAPGCLSEIFTKLRSGLFTTSTKENNELKMNLGSVYKNIFEL